jgi:K+-sensing histidine kinase KdpD
LTGRKCRCARVEASHAQAFEALLARIERELVTPLTCVLGYAEVLREAAFERLSPEERGLVEKIERNAALLRERVEELLSEGGSRAAGR